MNPKGVIYVAAFILMGISAAGRSPQRGDSILNLKIERESVTEKSLRDYYTAGAATMHFADKSSFSTAALTADIENFDSPVTVQDGSGHNIYRLSAESYYKLSAISTVWGHAGYYNGKTRDVTLCNVIGYETVAPFVSGDDAGGDLSGQQYDFGGGWGRTYGRWTVGVQADYRAATAHRAIDPRVRNIVSDLNVGIGGARRLGSRYMLGIDCGVRIYHQDTDVDFYNSTTHAITMIFTGLGSIASRFKGVDTQSSTHKLSGFDATIRIVPVTRGNCFYADLSCQMANADLILDGYNNLKFGTTSTLTIKGKLSRLVSIGHFSMFPTLSTIYMQRAATENLFGTSAENYEKIGQRENYHHNRIATLLDIPLSWGLNSRHGLITLDLQAGYNNDKEYLVEPARRIESRYITCGVMLDATKKIGSHWAVGLKPGYDGRFISSSSATWGGLDLSSPEGEMTLHNYSMSTCNLSALHAGINVSRALKTTVISLSVQYGRYDYSNLNKGSRIVTGLSLTF